MKRPVENVGDLVEFIQDFCGNPETPVLVTLDGNSFNIEYVELDGENNDLVHIRLEA